MLFTLETVSNNLIETWITLIILSVFGTGVLRNGVLTYKDSNLIKWWYAFVAHVFELTLISGFLVEVSDKLDGGFLSWGVILILCQQFLSIVGKLMFCHYYDKGQSYKFERNAGVVLLVLAYVLGFYMILLGL